MKKPDLIPIKRRLINYDLAPKTLILTVKRLPSNSQNLEPKENIKISNLLNSEKVKSKDLLDTEKSSIRTGARIQRKSLIDKNSSSYSTNSDLTYSLSYNSNSYITPAFCDSTELPIELRPVSLFQKDIENEEDIIDNEDSLLNQDNLEYEFNEVPKKSRSRVYLRQNRKMEEDTTIELIEEFADSSYQTPPSRIYKDNIMVKMIDDSLNE